MLLSHIQATSEVFLVLGALNWGAVIVGAFVPDDNPHWPAADLFALASGQPDAPISFKKFDWFPFGHEAITWTAVLGVYVYFLVSVSGLYVALSSRFTTLSRPLPMRIAYLLMVAGSLNWFSVVFIANSGSASNKDASSSSRDSPAYDVLYPFYYEAQYLEHSVQDVFQDIVIVLQFIVYTLVGLSGIVYSLLKLGPLCPLEIGLTRV